MRILFLGDVVGIAGCSILQNNLLSLINSKKIESQKIGLTNNEEIFMFVNLKLMVIEQDQLIN